MTANDVLNKKFDRAALGGYRMDDVNAFMLSVADEFESLYKEKMNLESKLVVLADRLETYRNDEESMRSALLGAQKLGDNIIKESKDKSDSMIEDSIREAESIVDNAKNEGDRIESESKLKLEAETYALNKMKREVARFKKQIMALYQQHITLLDGIPDQDSPVVPEKNAILDEPPKLSKPLTTNISQKNNLNEVKASENHADKKRIDLKEGFRIIEDKN